MHVPQETPECTNLQASVTITTIDVREAGAGRSRMIIVKAEEAADDDREEEQNLQ